MLSYRHAFHAGNHADVLKHLVQVQLLSYLNQKDKPYWYIDTHAGAGVYSLLDGYATKNAEFRTGIGRLWARTDLPAAVAEYVAAVKTLNPQGKLALYPGSPWLALQLIRSQDRLRLFELHPTDADLLQRNFAEHAKRGQILVADGFEGIKALLPTPSRRALTLIDPPYEDKRDYQHVVHCLQESLKRQANGVYAIWYPKLQLAASQQFVDKLKRLPIDSWLHVSLDVHRPRADGFGMHGSGMFIINPPWTLHQTLQTVMPWLTHELAQDDGAQYALEQQTK
ncbi:23S rRNA (adenine2030-N6)-methyltransferase [Chitinivorax tropicus]|uniref:Ribosomal RNA large subunit methyltransferase J n=1 Tax=Chitinivorax tropicus TaxID=714531 RepID=A0A840MJU4_9PROT|nr:23S rRNA (adenine(2030)-N(6))-methyltransferase RlmJ [Chitinivorax tropicus]MBB5016836.1 23S rRNA (adenine2030-N6)-methyltransferase [Chitinivorax tropicus]